MKYILRSVGDFSDGTGYLAMDDKGSYLITKDGTVQPFSKKSIEYSLKNGSWREVSPEEAAAKVRPRYFKHKDWTGGGGLAYYKLHGIIGFQMGENHRPYLTEDGNDENDTYNSIEKLKYYNFTEATEEEIMSTKGYRIVRAGEIIKEGDFHLNNGKKQYLKEVVGNVYKEIDTKGSWICYTKEEETTKKGGGIMKFKEGDKVKIVNFEASPFCGHVGRVTKHRVGQNYVVNFDDRPRGSIVVTESVMELVPTIKIGEYEVTGITNEGFKVGCQEVSWEDYDAIGKLRP